MESFLVLSSFRTDSSFTIITAHRRNHNMICRNFIFYCVYVLNLLPYVGVENHVDRDYLRVYTHTGTDGMVSFVRQKMKYKNGGLV